MNDNSPRMPSCPDCHSTQVRPSRFRAVELVLMALVLRPFRCRRCATRFWRFRLWPGLVRPRPELRIDHLRTTPTPY
jgi:predicted Zn-ribbon and HTH transcriptional regulator